MALVVPRSRPVVSRATGSASSSSSASLFFAAQLTAVLVLAEIGEADEPVAQEDDDRDGDDADRDDRRPRRRPPTTRRPSTTETTTETDRGRRAIPSRARRSSWRLPAASGCHTLADAGSTGTIGPNLDAVKPSYDKVVAQVTNGGGVMPPFEDTLTEQQIQDVAAYVSSVARKLAPTPR